MMMIKFNFKIILRIGSRVLLNTSPGVETRQGINVLNRILWFNAKGNQPYPKKMTIPKRERKDDDD
jgi:hypothetical protein